MVFDENLDVGDIAHRLIADGQVFEGYVLVLLQQIRDAIRKKKEVVKR